MNENRPFGEETLFDQTLAFTIHSFCTGSHWNLFSKKLKWFDLPVYQSSLASYTEQSTDNLQIYSHHWKLKNAL